LAFDTPINLERALRVGAEFGGHIVTGHVDAVAEVLSVEREGGSIRVRLRAPASLAAAIVAKGSVAVEGVSLTVNEVVGPAEFGVNIIPHTTKQTTLGTLVAGRAVNLEIDVLARYACRLASAQAYTD
jgi:riboflavin synthase